MAENLQSNSFPPGVLRKSCCIDMQSQPWIVYLAV